MKKRVWSKVAQNQLLISSVLLTVAYNLANFLHFIANFLLVKALPVAVYGEYASAVAYTALFSIPLSILALIIIQKVGQQHVHRRKVYFYNLEKRFWETIKKYWWLWLLTMVGLFYLLKNWANFNFDVSVIYILSALFLTVMTSFYGALLQGEKNFKAYSLTMILAAIIKVAGFMFIISFWPNLAIAYSVLIISNVTTIIWQRRLAIPRKNELPDRKGRWAPIPLGKIIRRQEIWLPILTMIGVMALINIDLILVKKLMTPEEAGLYGVISLLGKTVNYALFPITQVVFAFGASRETAGENRKQVQKVALFFAGAGLIATATYALWPKLLVTIFAKAEYISVAPYLWLAAVFGTLYSINTLLAQYFINQRKIVALISLIFVAGQILGISFLHQNLRQILLINIVMSAMLTACYLVSFISLKEREKGGEWLEMGVRRETERKAKI